MKPIIKHSEGAKSMLQKDADLFFDPVCSTYNYKFHGEGEDGVFQGRRGIDVDFRLLFLHPDSQSVEHVGAIHMFTMQSSCAFKFFRIFE